MDDIELIRQVQRGELGAFKKVIVQNQKIVSKLAARMIYIEEDRKDIAQDTFIKVYKNIAKFNFESKLSTWISRICYTTCLDYLKKKKSPLFSALQIITEEEDDSFEIAMVTVKDEEIIELNFQKKETKKIINEEIKKLPVLMKVIIELFHNEEMSYKEMETILNIPMGTIKSYLYRARKIIKDNLIKQYAKQEL